MITLKDLLIPIAILVVGVGFGVVGFLIRNLLNGLKDDISLLFKEFNKFKEEVLKNYVTKTDFSERIEENTKAHKELWGDLKEIREKTARMEGKRNGSSK